MCERISSEKPSPVQFLFCRTMISEILCCNFGSQWRYVRSSRYKNMYVISPLSLSLSQCYTWQQRVATTLSLIVAVAIFGVVLRKKTGE